MDATAPRSEDLVQWRSRAAGGDGEAARFLAILAASGVGVPHDLGVALGHLQRAAEHGCGAAQAELAALVGNWRLAREIGAGKTLRQGMPERLRAAVDLDAWQRLPDGELGFAHTDVVVAFVRSRIAALASVAIDGLEPSQIMHYEVGQEFRPHHDFFDPRIPAYAREAATRGQRALTVLVYLSDGYEGGHTAFPHLGRSFKGRKGNALVFWNVLEDGTPDWSTLHAGTAPTRGEKWLFSQWIRIRRP